MATKIGLSLAFVECRTWRHAWESFNPLGMKRPPYGTRQSLRCIRCGMQRHDVIDSLGELAQRRYIQPDGYKLARDETPTIQQLRLDLQTKLRTEAKDRVRNQTGKKG